MPTRAVPVRSYILACDHETGFGLLRARDPRDKVVPMALGDSEALVVGTPAVIASFGGPGVWNMGSAHRADKH